MLKACSAFAHSITVDTRDHMTLLAEIPRHLQRRRHSADLLQHVKPRVPEDVWWMISGLCETSPDYAVLPPLRTLNVPPLGILLPAPAVCCAI